MVRRKKIFFTSEIAEFVQNPYLQCLALRSVVSAARLQTTKLPTSIPKLFMEDLSTVFKEPFKIVKFRAVTEKQKTFESDREGKLRVWMLTAQE
jgi:lipopolysaccharide/colanic/teichoic acid biosynthesis glycosyltransferase